jgi:hypothetical protein
MNEESKRCGVQMKTESRVILKVPEEFALTNKEKQQATKRCNLTLLKPLKERSTDVQYCSEQFVISS